MKIILYILTTIMLLSLLACNIFESEDKKESFELTVKVVDENDNAIEGAGISFKNLVICSNEEISKNYPKTSTGLVFYIDETTKIKVSVFDYTGKFLILLNTYIAPVGLNSIIWHGTDEWGKPVETGIYTYLIEKINENNEVYSTLKGEKYYIKVSGKTNTNGEFKINEKSPFLNLCNKKSMIISGAGDDNLSILNFASETVICADLEIDGISYSGQKVFIAKNKKQSVKVVVKKTNY